MGGFVDDVLALGLSSWIIQDGNYEDFAQGDLAAFAVEFYAPKNLLESLPSLDKRPSMRHLEDSTYEVLGQVIHISEDWWAIDIGIPIFQEQAPPNGMVLGRWVRGSVWLGVDPFFYFERLSHDPGAPAMIFDWKIEVIEIQTAPFVEIEPRHMVRDKALLGWKSVERSDAWNDDNGHAEYLLRCRRQSNTARKTRNVART